MHTTTHVKCQKKSKKNPKKKKAGDVRVCLGARKSNKTQGSVYVRRALAFQFEDHKAGVMAGAEKVELRMSNNDPETIMLAAERLHARLLGHVPNAVEPYKQQQQRQCELMNNKERSKKDEEEKTDEPH